MVIISSGRVTACNSYALLALELCQGPPELSLNHSGGRLTPLAVNGVKIEVVIPWQPLCSFLQLNSNTEQVRFKVNLERQNYTSWIESFVTDYNYKVI